MEIENVSVVVILIGIITAGFIYGYIGMAQTPPTSDVSFNATFNQMNNEVARINQTTANMFSSGVNSQFGFAPTIQSFMGAGQVILGSLSALNQMVQEFAVNVGLPSYIVIGLGGLIGVLFLFAMYKATLGRWKI